MRVMVICVGLFFCASCGKTDPVNIAFVQTGGGIANRDLLIHVAREFYKTRGDDYDMLVVWGGPEFGPGHSFYLPVKNDVAGIGFQHSGPELFDQSSEFGSARLQGIIWMGPSWSTNENIPGPTSVLGILAQETGHRWGSTVHFADASKDGSSDALLGSPSHWNFYLDTGASPLWGNDWVSAGDGVFSASPVDHVAFSELDLYLMGLVDAEDVAPLRLLTDIRNEDGLPDGRFAPSARRVTEPVTVRAVEVTITIGQIIAVEGRRDPAEGLTARGIRQAWIYVSEKPGPPGALERFRMEWGRYFSDATGGRGMVSTTLSP